MLEEADLQAHCGNDIVHEAPVGFGQLARHDEVPAHESAHHEEQASHSETELISEAQRKAYGDGSCGVQERCQAYHHFEMALRLS